jgi:hypothetical protein
MKAPIVPPWVVNLCFITPFATLLITVCSGLCGNSSSFVALLCLTSLCGKVLSSILVANRILVEE